MVPPTQRPTSRRVYIRRAPAGSGCYLILGIGTGVREVVLARRVISDPRLPAPMRGGAFSSGVEAPAGRTIYVSGQVSMDTEGNVVGEGDIRRQTETVLEHVKTVVEAAGGGMDDIVKVTVFKTDLGLYDEIHEVRRRYFEEPYPASSMVDVAALIDPRLLIEIEAVAVIEEEIPRAWPPGVASYRIRARDSGT